MDKLISIKNFTCNYKGLPKVLEVDDLSFDRGNLYFLIGSSGSGKSTFLESIGLMSKPFDDDQNTKVKFRLNDNSDCDLLKLWSDSDEKLSDFRKQYYSFIFQNTNLMPFFSSGENMSFSSMMDGETFGHILQKINPVMEALRLDKDMVSGKIQHLSGGQRQRMAFVRAFVAPFEILFADEPTGNLDANTGKDLLKILQQHIKSNNKTGVVVSHDIRLALEFGDKIFHIEKIKDGDHTFGKLYNHSYIQNFEGQWQDAKSNVVSDPINYLQNFLV